MAVVCHSEIVEACLLDGAAFRPKNITVCCVNLLAPELFFFLNFSTPVYKM
jgi:hypothetical protein